MSKRSVVLPSRWARFANHYSSDLSYWYQPKGLAVNPNSVLPRLEALSKFEGRDWRSCQAAYVSELRASGISEASALWDDGGAPLARMIKQVFVALGLAWINEDDRVEISTAGQQILARGEAQAILSLQALRYQFWNPAIGAAVPHGVIKVHPVPFLVKLLFAIGNNLSNEEYILFAARARSIDMVEGVADHIHEWRTLDRDLQVSVIAKCKSYMIGGAKRSSIYNTISLNRTYAFRMWSLSELLESSSGGLSLVPRNYRGIEREFLERYIRDGTFINFANKKEFYSWFGNAETFPLRDVALEIYLDRGDLESSILLKREEGVPQAEIKKFERMFISEQALEDNIHANIGILSRAVGRDLKVVGRQYPTTIGVIDILAQDRESGRYVVIELKKGRAADKVFGQLSRYMGWVRANLADLENVDGVIVSSKSDPKLSAAVAGHDSNIKLVRYNSKISLSLEG